MQWLITSLVTAQRHAMAMLQQFLRVLKVIYIYSLAAILQLEIYMYNALIKICISRPAIYIYITPCRSVYVDWDFPRAESPFCLEKEEEEVLDPFCTFCTINQPLFSFDALTH